MNKSPVFGVGIEASPNTATSSRDAPHSYFAQAFPTDFLAQLHAVTTPALDRLNGHPVVNGLINPAFEVGAAATALNAYRLAYAVVAREIFEPFPELLQLLDWTPLDHAAVIDADLQGLQASGAWLATGVGSTQLGGYLRSSRPAAWASGALFSLLGVVPTTAQVSRAVALHSQGAINGLTFFQLHAEQSWYAKRLPNLLLARVKGELARNQAIGGAVDTLELFLDAFDAAAAAPRASPA